MSQLVFRNGNLATMSGEGLGVIEQGALVVTNGNIEYAGPENALPQLNPGHQEIDLKGSWLTPGLIDAHTHLVYAGNRSDEHIRRRAGVPYADIAAQGGGIRRTVRETRAATSDDLKSDARKRLKQLARGGVTTIEIKSGYGLDEATERRCLQVARELGDEGVASITTTYLGAHGFPPEFQDQPEAYLDWVIAEVMPGIVRDHLADAADAFCERVACNAGQTRRYLQAAKDLGLKLHLHADQLTDGGGGELAAALGALSADHLEYCSEASAQAMGEAGTVATHLPGAFYCLQEPQAPPVHWFREYRVPMAVATDCNPGTSPVTNLPLMMHMATTMFGLTVEEAWQGVTKNAARALGMKDRGELRPGLRADLAVWEFDHPQDLLASLGIYECQGTWLAGQAVQL
ncbi:MAG TPA: imidazolonepropionase [Fimbriimonadaceae bacterium]|nr:imidazolonepropionase [Armatimonadota bacterium]HRD30110.1 imidazolonepropionase [Fimbriimonadaceae bacterium]HRE94397.1 imidazolonepropionase [Fimbriimonadaceae bacterium]HRI74839.1 imidazolonepropionase [Fimbriimonadaceae bacterium]